MNSTESNAGSFLDDKVIWQNVQVILQLLGGITMIHVTFILSFEKSQVKKLPFQITNLVINFIMSIMGIYSWIMMNSNDTTDNEKISGFVNMAVFGSAQIAYQLWSIPVGLSFDEKPIMLVHHFATLASASIVTFFEQGYRFHAVYFCGVMELSTLPLCIINIFKENRVLIEKHPLKYSLSRNLFAVTFVLVRVLLLIPIWSEYISLLWNANMDSSGLSLLAFRVLFYPSAFLLLLQMYWAYLILKALLPKKWKEY